MNLRSEHLHTLDIGVLSLDIGLSHEYLALHVHQCAHSSRGNAMLPCSRLGDDSCLAHLLCHEYLADGIVYLMCSGMIEILTFKIYPATILLAHSACEIKR